MVRDNQPSNRSTFTKPQLEKNQPRHRQNITGSQENKTRRAQNSLYRNWGRMKMTSTWRKTSTRNILTPQNTPTLRRTDLQQSPSSPDERGRTPYNEKEKRQVASGICEAE